MFTNKSGIACFFAPGIEMISTSISRFSYICVWTYLDTDVAFGTHLVKRDWIEVNG